MWMSQEIYQQQKDDAGNVKERWLLTDLESAVQWCKKRVSQGIRCTVAVAGEFVQNREESELAVMTQVSAIRILGSSLRGASFAIKPSSLGILFDHTEYERNLSRIVHEANASGVSLEIDMEGRRYVEDTILSALPLVAKGVNLTIALQAYLDRTPDDLELCRGAGMIIRLVKGAYVGDSNDFITVQEKFRNLAGALISADIPFSAATHDPELITWLKEKVPDRKDHVEFAFLKGLAEETKIGMAASGWKVAEYVPFGPGGQGYIRRRQRYLETLTDLKRAPVP
jgi:proline dehydrogenase